MQSQQSPLDAFEHVVVLMLENRSFDNLLGYLYETGVPPNKQFAGVSGNNLSNPDENGNPVPVSVGTDFHQPYPDPGEYVQDPLLISKALNTAQDARDVLERAEKLRHLGAPLPS